MVKLTQTKWKGVVSHRVSTRMTATFAAANIAQPTSSQCLRSLEPIPDISHRLDELGTKLRPKPADIDVHHVASRIEGVAPHVCQQLFPGTHLARLPHQVLENDELVPAAPGQLQSPNPVMRTVHPESLRGESPRDEAHDPRLVVDHQDSGHSKGILGKLSPVGPMDDETVTYRRRGRERIVTA